MGEAWNMLGKKINKLVNNFLYKLVSLMQKNK